MIEGVSGVFLIAARGDILGEGNVTWDSSLMDAKKSISVPLAWVAKGILVDKLSEAAAVGELGDRLRPPPVLELDPAVLIVLEFKPTPTLDPDFLKGLEIPLINREGLTGRGTVSKDVLGGGSENSKSSRLDDEKDAASAVAVADAATSDDNADISAASKLPRLVVRRGDDAE